MQYQPDYEKAASTECDWLSEFPRVRQKKGGGRYCAEGARTPDPTGNKLAEAERPVLLGGAEPKDRLGQPTDRKYRDEISARQCDGIQSVVPFAHHAHEYGDNRKSQGRRDHPTDHVCTHISNDVTHRQCSGPSERRSDLQLQLSRSQSLVVPSHSARVIQTESHEHAEQCTHESSTNENNGRSRPDIIVRPRRERSIDELQSVFFLRLGKHQPLHLILDQAVDSNLYCNNSCLLCLRGKELDITLALLDRLVSQFG